jgi:hypothetical protein
LDYFYPAAIAFAEATSIPKPLKNLSFFNATFPKISESRPGQYDALTPFATDDLEHARILKPSLHLCLYVNMALKVIKIYGGFF